MKGTEKQIVWATDIISKIIPVMEQAVFDIHNMAGNEKIKAANIAGFEQRIAALKEAEYAGDVISAFGHVRLSGNQQQDISKILAAYRVTLPETNGMKKILCK